jgi:hypothetical protein
MQADQGEKHATPKRSKTPQIIGKIIKNRPKNPAHKPANLVPQSRPPTQPPSPSICRAK